jgi:beta-glucosidase
MVAGDEVPQLYFQQENGSVTTYELNLAGFQRVHLKPGESRDVTFKLPAKRLEIIDRTGRRRVEPGFFKLIIGSSSEDHRLHTRFEVTTGILISEEILNRRWTRMNADHIDVGR